MNTEDTRWLKLVEAARRDCPDLVRAGGTAPPGFAARTLARRQVVVDAVQWLAGLRRATLWGAGLAAAASLVAVASLPAPDDTAPALAMPQLDLPDLLPR